jgi:peroxiredoxin Q/BCP
METYGAFGEKKMYGKVVMGVIRSTVWIGPGGNVRKHWAKVVKADEHPARVFETLKSSI